MAAVEQIPEELVDFVESGVSILVGTRDAELRSDATRAVGARVSTDRAQVTIFLALQGAKRALANVANNGQIAVGFSRPFDHYSIQIKGGVTEQRPATDAERVVPERYHAAYVDQLYMVGMPRSITKRFIVWPSVAVTLDVHEIFVQTPGPGAGKRIGAS